jgi:hypothetical protein
MRLTAESVAVESDEEGFELLVRTEEGDTLSIDIQSCVLAFYESVQKEIGWYAAEAEQARADIATGTFSARTGVLSSIADQDASQASSGDDLSSDEAEAYPVGHRKWWALQDGVGE